MSGAECGTAARGHNSEARLVQALKVIDEIIAIDSIYCTLFHDDAKLQEIDLDTEFRLYLPKVVELIVDLFTEYTGDQCAVCIKALSLTPDIPNVTDANQAAPGADLPFVYTFWRDYRSHAARAELDRDPRLRIYRHRRNTGLTNARKNGYWHCNDLAALGPTYKRSNPIWSRFYNATAIVNLAYRSEGQSIHPLGFLCVDNMRGGFDDEACRYILEILANILHFSVRTTLSLSLKMGNQNDQGQSGA